MDWFRVWHGTVSDLKWALIAKKSGQPKHVVLAVWIAMLEAASTCAARGSLEDFDVEVVEAALDLPEGAAQAVYEAMCDKGIIKDGAISAWAKRQPEREREDDNSAERVRRYRERQKAKQSADVTPCNADVTPCNADVTPCNATKRHVTPPEQIQNREEQNRTHTPLPLACEGDAACVAQGSPSPGSREAGTNPRALGTNPRSKGANPRANGENPRALGTNPRAIQAKEPETELLPHEEYGLDFLELCEAYGEPATQAAHIAWKALIKRRAAPGLPRLLQAITAWEDSGEWERDGGRFKPRMENWLAKELYLRAPPGMNPRDGPDAMERLKQKLKAEADAEEAQHAKV